MPKLRAAVTTPKRRGAPAKTLEARENQLVSLATDLAEKQLSDGTATSQVIVHYLKLGTTMERLEKEKLLRENELLKAKTDSLQSAKRIEDLYANALRSMQRYSGAENEMDADNDPNL